MDNTIVRFIGLPPKIKAFVVRDEQGDYNMYINAHLSFEQATKAYVHERWHIENGDFDSLLDIREIEAAAEQSERQSAKGGSAYYDYALA